jgi:hypothetical protein
MISIRMGDLLFIGSNGSNGSNGFHLFDWFGSSACLGVRPRAPRSGALGAYEGDAETLGEEKAKVKQD